MNRVRFPFALLEGTSVVGAAIAPRGKRFFCLDCGTEMVLRRGHVKSPHFAHKAGDTGGCSVESTVHLAAKAMICETLRNAWAGEGQFPAIHVRCSECRNRWADVAPALLPSISSRSGRAVCEYRVPTSEGRVVVDVAVLSAVQPTLFIEVFAQHLVPDDKWTQLAGHRTPCIEVDAWEVVNNPLVLRPIKRSHDLHERCEECKTPAEPQWQSEGLIHGGFRRIIDVLEGEKDERAMRNDEHAMYGRAWVKQVVRETPPFAVERERDEILLMLFDDKSDVGQRRMEWASALTSLDLVTWWRFACWLEFEEEIPQLEAQRRAIKLAAA